LRVNRAVPLAIVLLALALRLIRLTHFGLGNDEIAEVFWSALPLRDMLHFVAKDGVHPPLDYLMQFVLDRISNSEWIWRLPRVLAGTATVAAMMELARRWFDERVAIAAGLLLAISPMHIRFSQEVRPYAFGLFWLVLAILLLAQRRFVAWFVAVYLAAMTLYFAGMIAGLVSIAAIVLAIPELRRRLPLIVGGWIVLYAPWLPVVFSAARATPPNGRDALTWPWLAYRLQTLGTGDWQRDPISLGSWLLWVLAASGVWLAMRNRRTAPLAIWLVAGLALQIVALQLRPHYPAVRHLLPAWIAVFPLAAAGMRRWSITIAALLVIALFDARTLRDYYGHGRPEWNRVARFVADRVQPGERVITANNWTDLNFGWYWHRQPRVVDVERRTIPTHIDGPAWLVIGECGTQPEVARLPLARAFPYTNHCQIRYIPRGTALDMPALCP
jgi:Dolichyl-phosphate-mannose-protein mannosyltransferase